MHPRLAAARLLALQFRRHIAVLAAGLFAWSLLNGAHKGQQIVVAAEPIAAGQTVAQSQLAVAWLDGPSVAGYATDPESLVGRSLLRSVSATSPLMLSDLEVQSNAPERIVVDLPLDAGAGGDYQVGTAVHVWAIGDEGAWLLTEAGIVAGLSEGGSMNGRRVLLSLPQASESAAMGVAAVRLAVVSRGGADG